MIVNEGIDNAIIVFKGHVLGEKPNSIQKDEQKKENMKQIAKMMKAGVSGNIIVVYFMLSLHYSYLGLLQFPISITVLEFFIIGTISMALLPFGLLDRTKAVVDKILNYFFVSAIRIAIFLFLVLIINPTVKKCL